MLDQKVTGIFPTGAVAAYVAIGQVRRMLAERLSAASKKKRVRR
jgi:hypothetical protein